MGGGGGGEGGDPIRSLLSFLSKHSCTKMTSSSMSSALKTPAGWERPDKHATRLHVSVVGSRIFILHLRLAAAASNSRRSERKWSQNMSCYLNESELCYLVNSSNAPSQAVFQ